MNIRLNRCVFLRHAGDESIVWNPRESGFSVFKDAQVFLKELKRDWRDEKVMLKNIAKKFDCDAGQVYEDFRGIVKELEDQRFVLIEGLTESVGSGELSDIEERGGLGQTSMPDNMDDMLRFCERHNIVRALHLDLTDACTEKCVHCYVPQKKHFISYKMAEKVLKEFREQNGFTVYLTGGECMLHPDFKRICELCVELNLNMIAMTNMTCCDAGMVKLLRKVDPQYLNVSLYSMKPEEHDAVTRLPGSWQKTMDAILACEKAGVHIRIATPLLKENKEAFGELKKFAAEHHMHLIPSADIVAMSNHDCANTAHACSPDELKCVMTKCKGIFDHGWDGEMPKCDAKVCDIGTARIYVNAKGDYYPCDSMHEYVLGNVATHTLQEVWRGEKLEYLRGLKNRDFGKCASCENRPWCKVCPAANFNATGDIFKTAPGRCEQARVVREVYGR